MVKKFGGQFELNLLPNTEFFDFMEVPEEESKLYLYSLGMKFSFWVSLSESVVATEEMALIAQTNEKRSRITALLSSNFILEFM